MFDEFRPGAEGQGSSVVVRQVRSRLTGLKVQILKYVDLPFNADLHKENRSYSSIPTDLETDDDAFCAYLCRRHLQRVVVEDDGL